MRKWGLFIGLVLMLGLGTGVILQWLDRIEHKPLLANDAEAVVIDIPRGSSFSQIADRFAGAGLFDNRLILTAYARWQGLAPRIQAGEYAVQPGESAAGLLRRMAAGEVIQYDLTIIEGWRFQELLGVIRAHPAIEKTLPETASDAEVMAAIGRAGQHPEGRFLPETFRFPRGTSDVEILRRANRSLESALASAWAARAGSLPLESAEEALILASIIEKETGLAEERRRIAGVFARRLERGMRLQTDPTVIYGLGDAFDGDLLRLHLRTDTPYNTYTRHGLPPTPIALPSKAAIEAAVNPAPGESLFFVSRGDGSHVFSKTYDAHRAAVRRYQLGIEE